MDRLDHFGLAVDAATNDACRWRQCYRPDEVGELRATTGLSDDGTPNIFVTGSAVCLQYVVSPDV